MRDCPNCRAQASDEDIECPGCGLIFAKWAAAPQSKPHPTLAAARWGKRIPAAIVDYCAFMALRLLLSSRGHGDFGKKLLGYSSHQRMSRDMAIVSIAMDCLIPPLLISLTQALPLAYAQTTLGKALFGLRVSRLDGDNPGLGQALVRSAAYAVIISFSSFFFIGGPPALFLVALSNTRRQCVHDLLAGTFVVEGGATTTGSFSRSVLLIFAMAAVLVYIGWWVVIILLGWSLAHSPMPR